MASLFFFVHADQSRLSKNMIDSLHIRWIVRICPEMFRF